MFEDNLYSSRFLYTFERIHCTCLACLGQDEASV